MTTKKTLSMTRNDFIEKATPKIIDFLRSYESWDGVLIDGIQDGIVIILNAYNDKDIWCGLDEEVPTLFDWQDDTTYKTEIALEDMGCPHTDDPGWNDPELLDCEWEDAGGWPVWIDTVFYSPANYRFADICRDFADRMYDTLLELLNEES